MAAAGPREVERSGGPDLRRIAADLDHIRLLGSLAAGRLESLRVAAAVLRAIEAAATTREICPGNRRTPAHPDNRPLDHPCPRPFL